MTRIAGILLLSLTITAGRVWAQDEDLIGFNCAPVAVKGNKIRMLRILGQGLRRRQIHLSAEAPAAPGKSL